MWVLWETSEPQCPQCSPVLPVKAQSGAKGPQSLPRPEAADSPVPLHLCPGPSLRSPPRPWRGYRESCWSGRTEGGQRHARRAGRPGRRPGRLALPPRALCCCCSLGRCWGGSEMGLSVSILTATCCSRPGGRSAEGSGGEASREASSGPFAPVRLCVTWGWTSGLALLSRAWRRDSRASVCHPPPPGIPSPMRSRPCSFLQNIPVEMIQTLLLNPGIIVMSFLAGLAWDPPSPGGLSPHPEHVGTTCKPPGPGKGARAGP